MRLSDNEDVMKSLHEASIYML